MDYLSGSTEIVPIAGTVHQLGQAVPWMFGAILVATCIAIIALRLSAATTASRRTGWRRSAEDIEIRPYVGPAEEQLAR